MRGLLKLYELSDCRDGSFDSVSTRSIKAFGKKVGGPRNFRISKEMPLREAEHSNAPSHKLVVKLGRTRSESGLSRKNGEAKHIMRRKQPEW